MAKYFCDFTTVYNFCKLNNIYYQSFCSSIRYRIKNTKNDLNYIIKDVKEVYLNKRNKNIILKHIEILKNDNKIKNKHFLQDCKFLNISSKNVNYISKLNYHPSMVLIVLFFFVKDKNTRGQVVINRKKFEKLLETIKTDKTLKNGVLLYITNDKTIDEIYELIDKNLIPRKARKILRKYSLPSDSIEDIESELTIKLFTIIRTLLPYENEQIYKYIHIMLNSTISEIYINNRRIEMSIYKKVNNSDKKLIDYLSA